MKLLSASFALPSLPLLLLLIIQLFQFPATILAQNATFVPLYACPDTITNYTSGSQFESNLRNLLFPTLISSGSLNGFFNTSSGTGPDTIYGLVQCRFDVSADNCKSCLTIASASILQNCPNKMDAIIRHVECLFRYSNVRFFSKMISTDLWYKTWRWENDKNITDLPVFNNQLGVLFTNLTSLASSKPLKYATGKIGYGDFFSNIYGLADCTQDLSSADCFSCLQIALSKIPGCCSGDKNGWVLTDRCQIWYRDFEFFGTPRALPSLPPPPPPPSTKTSPVSLSPVDVTKDDTKGKSRHSSSSPKIAVIVGLALAGLAVLILSIVLCVCYIRRKGPKKPNNSKIIDEDIRSSESLQFEFVTIRTATENFSNNHKLGEGGFGEVYKGELPNGQEIAVKRLSKNSGQGLEEFKNEVVLLHKLQHRNLVRLLGFCLEGIEKLLIYEYVPNRSLDKHLFAPTKREFFDWGKRYKIIGGIARGLLYLHEDSRLRIIHRDLKAANILLDGEMDAKIADFGMAKLFGSNQTQGNTSRIGGTFGYMAPEYALHGLFSVKSDVFSFGVLVLEIVVGQRITSFHKSYPQQNLLSYAWKQWREGTGLALLDPALSDSFSEMEVMKSLNIGLLCVQEKPENRPTMSSVVSMLNSNAVTMASPSQPAFFTDIDIYSNMGTVREQETDLYKQQQLEPNHSVASSSKSDYASGMGFAKTTPR